MIKIILTMQCFTMSSGALRRGRARCLYIPLHGFLLVELRRRMQDYCINFALDVAILPIIPGKPSFF